MPPKATVKAAIRIHQGDCLDVLRTLPSESVNCCVTSPPYFGLRDYGHDGQIGLEGTPDEFVEKLVAVFREVKRVLRDDGTLWLNLGDSYASYRDGKATPDTARGDSKGTQVPKGSARNRMSSTFSGTGIKHKDLIGIPWRVAFALQADGWYLRQDIIWSKPNPMPESVKDRCTKAHEYIFMLTKSKNYYYDNEAIKEDAIYVGTSGQDASGYKDAKKFNGKHSDKQRGHSRRHAGFNERWDKMSKEQQCSEKRNKRSVWEVATRPFAGAHFATFPPDLIEPCILAGCPVGGIVLDPFMGSGTTALVSDRLQRSSWGIELNADYIEIARKRIANEQGMFGTLEIV